MDRQSHNSLILIAVFYLTCSITLSFGQCKTVELRAISLTNGILKLEVKNKTKYDLNIMTNISSGTHESIVEQNKKYSNFILFSVGSLDNLNDTLLYYPIFNSDRIHPEYSKLKKRKSIDLEVNLNSYYKWDKFLEINAETTVYGRFRIFYVENSNTNFVDLVLNIKEIKG